MDLPTLYQHIPTLTDIYTGMLPTSLITMSVYIGIKDLNIVGNTIAFKKKLLYEILRTHADCT